MPPKKQQQQSTSAYIPFYILPLFLSKSNQISSAQSILRNKPINIKKSIDKNKIIQILKYKGLQKYLNQDGTIQSQGRQFISENIKTVMTQFINQVNKPIDPKKDNAKKDTKKDTKKEEAVVQQKQPTIQLSLTKKCNDFFIFLDFPSNVQQLQKSIQNGMIIDALVLIQEKTKKGSKIPDLNILGKTIEMDHLMETFNQTKIQDDALIKNKIINSDSKKNNKQIIQFLRKLKSQNPLFQDLLVLQIPFQKDISYPQRNQMYFINNFFAKLSEITIDKQVYTKWIKESVKTSPMVQPFKQIVKKQVPIQNTDKKGKKDANKQPEFQIVQQVVQTKYESFPKNIKSDLIKYKQISSSINSDQNNDSYPSIKDILQICIQDVSNQSNKQQKQDSVKNALKDISENIISKKLHLLNSIPVSKLNTKEILSKNLRKVQNHSNNSDLNYNLISESKQISKAFPSFIQLLHKDPHQRDVLYFEYIMMNFYQFMKKEQPQINWDFSDRHYRQKLSKEQILSQIQKQFLKDPKIFQAILPQDKIRLLCLAKINPPGRQLYVNNIFDLKAKPNFEYWFKNLKGKQSILTQFLDYKYSQIGNLSIKRQKYMPSDNSIITDESIQIGNSLFKVNYIQKQNVFYGLKKQNKDGSTFWLSNQKHNISLSIFQKQHQFIKKSIVTQEIIDQATSEKKVGQNIIQSIQTQKRMQSWFRTKKYILRNNPYPIINWLYKNINKNNKFYQIRRQFGPKGEVTSYFKDGSIKILYLNGNISTFKNNKWQRIVNHVYCGSKQLKFKQFIQGNKLIKIRQDQTIFINFSNNNSLTIFKDNTKFFYDNSTKSYQIMNNNTILNEEIIIRIYLPKNKDFNIIGHGSAFAYLGYNNILQRTYDGFLYQFWSNQFSTHLYNEKYQYQNKIYEEQIRLIYLKDGSIIKLQGKSGNVIYVQRNSTLSHGTDCLSYQWNQIFTTEENHQEGVYSANIKEGYIKTKDLESNSFKIMNDQQNQVNIAVSFKMDGDQKRKNQYGNGFHVPQQNYFLPAPSKSIPSRVFSFDHENQTYYEYLNEQQIKQMQLAQNQYYIQQISRQKKTFKQYTKQLKEQKILQYKNHITFSKLPNRQNFDLPSILLEKQTVLNMKIEQQPIEFRIIEKVFWNKDFQNIKMNQEKIMKNKQEREKLMKLTQV